MSWLGLGCFRIWSTPFYKQLLPSCPYQLLPLQTPSHPSKQPPKVSPTLQSNFISLPPTDPCSCLHHSIRHISLHCQFTCIFPQGDPKPRVSKNHILFDFMASLAAQCLAREKCSPNICRMNESVPILLIRRGSKYLKKERKITFAGQIFAITGISWEQGSIVRQKRFIC